MKTSLFTYWVLVADSGNARIFELKQTPAEFREVHTMVSDAQHKRSSELVSDRGGHSFDAQGPTGHSKEQKSDPHELAEQAFCRKLVDKLELAANAKVFERLVVAADPKTMGRLRSLMSSQLRKRVMHEVTRDLVAMPPEKLKTKIRAELGWAD
jgi:protein required for attachment to host cells